ncbi:unnamed protein product [Protopolystoma xenopodis]|uniref:Uncharacterized protein n=1 Tax=Protopolystoma xenopodis TaxID=117903 RepID=A0A3S5CV57_9PLAT|nr:unnamed protein product [Protopolystoma xenopodis]
MQPSPFVMPVKSADCGVQKVFDCSDLNLSIRRSSRKRVCCDATFLEFLTDVEIVASIVHFMGVADSASSVDSRFSPGPTELGVFCIRVDCLQSPNSSSKGSRRSATDIICYVAWLLPEVNRSRSLKFRSLGHRPDYRLLLHTKGPREQTRNTYPSLRTHPVTIVISIAASLVVDWIRPSRGLATSRAHKVTPRDQASNCLTRWPGTSVSCSMPHHDSGRRGRHCLLPITTGLSSCPLLARIAASSCQSRRHSARMDKEEQVGWPCYRRDREYTTQRSVGQRREGQAVCRDRDRRLAPINPFTGPGDKVSFVCFLTWRPAALSSPLRLTF